MRGEVAGPLFGVFERPAVLWEVEVLDAELAAVVELNQAGEDRGEVDSTRRVIDVHLGVAPLALAELHVVGEREQLARITAPVGDVPVAAGLSSSAAIEMATARAFAQVAGFEWEPVRMAKAGRRAENDWIGVNSGIMDQMASAACRAAFPILRRSELSTNGDGLSSRSF